MGEWNVDTPLDYYNYYAELWELTPVTLFTMDTLVRTAQLGPLSSILPSYLTPRRPLIWDLKLADCHALNRTFEDLSGMQEDPEVQPAAVSTRPGGLSITSYIASVYCLSTHQQRWNISLALKLVSFSKTLTLSP